jgi:AraC-like DNA-binding protein
LFTLSRQSPVLLRQQAVLPACCFYFYVQSQRMENFFQQLLPNLLAYAAQRDVAPQQLCSLAGIDWQAVKTKTAAPLTPVQLNNLWQNACYLTGDALFGLHFGEALQLQALGVVGELIRSSQTVGEALTHAVAFSNLVTDAFTMELQTGKDCFSLSLVANKSMEKAFPFVFKQLLDLSLVFVLHELDGLVLTKIKPQKIQLPFSVAPYEQEYERVLRCRPVKKAGNYVLQFDKLYWDEPIITANYEMQRHWLNKATEWSAGLSGNGKVYKEKIVHFISTNAYLGVPSLEEIAANFATSPRSLQRKLQEEGVTYQELADGIRKTLALHYLQTGNYPVKEISYMLGYNEASAFTRAFKRWTGKSPAQYQPD